MRKSLLRILFAVFVYLNIGFLYSLIAEEKVKYEKNPSLLSIVKYSFPSSAPKDWKQYQSLEEPKLDDLRLSFPKKFPASYLGPDGGAVYLWKPGLYRWNRSDGTIFQEWENGNWQLQIPELVTIDVFKPKCNGCAAIFRYHWQDGTEIDKYWVAHRKEYAVTYQNESREPTENWLIPNPKQFGKSRVTIGPYEFYYAEFWNFYLQGLRESFQANAFLSYAESEFGLSNKGRIPVLLFDKSPEFIAYNGRNLPGLSSEGGFGGQDSIVMCCGSNLKQATGNAVLDLDSQMRTYFGTFYHEATHNLHQIACLTKRKGKAGLPIPNQDDPWFVEGLANHLAAHSFPQKQAEIYEDLAKKVAANRIPRDFDQMLKEEYRDLLPYSLGAFLVEYMHREYGKESIQKYIDLSCLGKPTREVVREVTGKEPSRFYSDAIADFKQVFPKSSKQIKIWKYGHLTKISPVNIQAFENFQKKRIFIPKNISEIKDINEIPDLKKIFEADVSSYVGAVEGDFYGYNGEKFYLWKQGNYKWYDDDYELVYIPNNSYILKYKGWEVINWTNGQRRMTAPDGTNVVFWNENEKEYYGKDGRPL